MNDAKLIAEAIFPTDWKVFPNGLKVDQNAGRRHFAEFVAAHFIRTLQKDQTARAVMFAFFRREHGREPMEDEARHLQCHMGTALLAAVHALSAPPLEGCEHEYGLRLFDSCTDSVNSI